MYVCKFIFFNECIYEYYVNYSHMFMYVCMGECMRCGTVGVWQVAGSYALSYCKGRVPYYLVSGMNIYPSVQEEGDCAIMAPIGSVMKSADSILQQGHTDRQTDAG